MRNLGLVILAALAMAACGKSTDSGTDNGSGGDVPVGPDGVVLVDGVQAETSMDVDYPKECTTNADCEAKATAAGLDPTLAACDCNNACVQTTPMAQGGCREDKNCGSAAYCDPCNKVCKPKLLACQDCDNDYQCDPDTRCVGEFTYLGLGVSFEKKVCAPLCLTSTRVCTVEGAPVNSFVCADAAVDANYGACIPISLSCKDTVQKCNADSDCPDTVKQKCWTDLHICGCRDTLACDFGTYCNKNTHKCVPGCSSDTECGKDKICDLGECRDACTGSLTGSNVTGCPSELPSGFEDKAWDCVKGHCKIPGMCFQPTDCIEQETYCDADTHTCKKGCLIDFDCKTSAKICDTQAKVCIDKGCTGNFECGCGQVCNLGNDHCETAVGKYCEPCDQNNGDTACGEKTTMCIGFKDQKTNEDKGSYCMPPCGSDPDNPCPQGWQCEDVKDDKGVSQGKVCVRFCYVEVKGGCAMGQPSNFAEGAEPSGETSTTETASTSEI